MGNQCCAGDHICSTTEIKTKLSGTY